MRRLASALLALLALALAGCGSEAAREAAERSDDPVISAAAKAADEETARITMAVSAEGEPGQVTGDGVIDLVEGDEGRLVLLVPGPDGQPQETEMRIVDDVGYLKEPGGDRWLRISEEDVLAANGGAPTASLAEQNPVEMIRLLERSTDVAESGTAELAGEEMTQYTGLVDFAELTEEQDEALARQLRDAGLDQLPIEVLVDGEGRLRKVSFEMDMSKVQQGAPVVTFTIELSDFGTEVDVEAPPSDKQVKPDGDPVDGPPTEES
jgi:hypothetical protein